jgi:predicted nucleic acid-binding protein
MFLLDSNVYIAAFVDRAFGAAFERFHRARLGQILLSAVVIHELEVGARSPRRLRDLRRGLIEPFRTRRRIRVPGLSTWELASETDRRLRRLGGYEASLQQRSFANDLLLAATARELGAVLVTRNLDDFEIIAQVLPFHFTAPWPAST